MPRIARTCIALVLAGPGPAAVRADSATNETAATIDDLGRQAEDHVRRGENLAAARALRRQAEAFLGFDRWRELSTLAVDTPKDWTASRRLQRTLALEALDRAIALAGDDGLAAEATFRKGELYRERGLDDLADFDLALMAYRGLVQRWPQSSEAPLALLRIGEILESERADFVAAADHYQRVVDQCAGSPAAGTARDRLARIVAPALALGVDGPVAPGTSADVHFVARNVKHVHLRAYRVELLAELRRGGIEWLNTWNESGEPAATWELPVPDDGTHATFDSRRDPGLAPTRLPLAGSGAYLVVGQADTAEGSTRARALVLVSSLASVWQRDRDRMLVFAADAQRGGPRRRAEVLVVRDRDGERPSFQNATTDDAGLALIVSPSDRQANVSALLAVRDGDHYAVCSLDSDASSSEPGGSAYVTYTITDLPAYAPGSVVRFKQIVRQRADDRYENCANKQVVVRLRDSRGEVVGEQALASSELGTVTGEWSFPPDTPPGPFWIDSAIDGAAAIELGADPAFAVGEQRRPEFRLALAEAAITRDRDAVPRNRPVGEPIEWTCTATYDHGGAVANAAVRYRVYRSPHVARLKPPAGWPWPELATATLDDAEWATRTAQGYTGLDRGAQPELILSGAGTTDAGGQFAVHVPTAPLPAMGDGDWAFTIELDVIDASNHTVSANASTLVAHVPFHIDLVPRQGICAPGEPVIVNVTGGTLEGAGVRFRGRARIYRLRRRVERVAGEDLDRVELGDEVFSERVTLDESARGRLEWTPQDEGPYRIVLATQSKDGVLVSGACDVWVVRERGSFANYAYRELELISDKPAYAAGDTIRLLINTRLEDAFVLLNVAAGRLIEQRLVHVAGGTQLVEVAVSDAGAPNVFILAQSVNAESIARAALELPVASRQKALTIELAPASPSFRPMQAGSLSVVTRAADGSPVSADVTLWTSTPDADSGQPRWRAPHSALYERLRPFAIRSGDSLTRRDGSAHGFAELQRGRLRRRVAGAENDAGPIVPPHDERVTAPSAPLLWLTNVRTGADGRASVEWNFPDAMAAWPLHAVAVDDQTRIGQATCDLVTRKDVVVCLDAPRRLVEQDHAWACAIARNGLPMDKTVQVELMASAEMSVNAAEVDGVPHPFIKSNTVELVVPAGGERTVEFAVSAVAAGEAVLTAWARGNTESDAAEVRVHIAARGTRQAVASGAVLTAGGADHVNLPLFLPDGCDIRASEVRLHVTPSLARVVLDAVPGTAESPNSVTEYGIHRVVSAVIARRMLGALGYAPGDLQRRVEASGGVYVDAALARLNSNAATNDETLKRLVAATLADLSAAQRPDGGWGWRPDAETDRLLTARIVAALVEIQRDGIDVSRPMFERAATLLREQTITRRQAGDNPPAKALDERAWLLYALGCDNPLNLLQVELRTALNELDGDRGGLSDTGLSLLAIMLHQIGDIDRARRAAEPLARSASTDEPGGTAHWPGTEPVARTALALLALLRVEPHSRSVQPAVNWLASARVGPAWPGDGANALAIRALAEAIGATAAAGSTMTAEVRLDGRTLHAFDGSSHDMLTGQASLRIGPHDLTPGAHTVSVERNGSESLFVALVADCAVSAAMNPTAPAVSVARHYARLVARPVEKRRRVWDEKLRRDVEQTYADVEFDRVPVAPGETLSLGDRIEVQLSLYAPADTRYVTVEDHLPAGCRTVELHGGRRLRSPMREHVECDDTRVAFSIDRVPAGAHTLTYVIRCQSIGSFAALPPRAIALDAPQAACIGNLDRLTIARPAAVPEPTLSANR